MAAGRVALHLKPVRTVSSGTGDRTASRMHFLMPTDVTPHSFSSSTVIFCSSTRSSKSFSRSCFAVADTFEGVTPMSFSQSSSRKGSASATEAVTTIIECKAEKGGRGEQR